MIDVRDLKFRAWDKENECWFKPTYEAYKGRLEDLSITLNGKYLIRTMEQSAIHAPERFEVMQYTGLKDKNGKEIYEGDVLKGNSFATSMLKGWGADVEQQFEVYEIRYDEASFKTFDKKGEWVAILNHHVSSKVKDLEVIGNIYENKDLLNA